MDTLTAIDIAEKEAFETLRGEVEYRCLQFQVLRVFSTILGERTRETAPNKCSHPR